MNPAQQHSLKLLVQGAVIAALYTALTLLAAPISFGSIQLRVSEALTVLPVFTPAAIPGLFIGCLISNLLGGGGLPDILVGSMATLLAAWLTFRLRIFPAWVALLPPVVVNALAVGLVIHILYGLAYPLAALYVAAGQTLACFALGGGLYWALRKNATLYRLIADPRTAPRSRRNV